MKRDGRPLIVLSDRLPERRFLLLGSRVQRSPSNPALGVLPRAFNHARDAPGIAQARGFTLLEILLALVLLAFVMLGVWGAMRGATRVTHSADAVMARSESVRTVQQFLRRYVAAAAPQAYTPNAGARPRVFTGTATTMQFVAPLPLQSGHAGLYVQTVSLQHAGTDGMSLELAYRPYARGQHGNPQPVHHLLLADLRGGQFQYLGGGEFGKPATWHADWTSMHGLPLAVRIRIDPAWPGRVAFPTMVIPLHAGGGSVAALAGGAL